MVPNAEGVTYLSFLLILDAFYDQFKSLFNFIHSLVILTDYILSLKIELLTKISLFIDFILLSIEFFFKLHNFLILIKLIDLVLENSTVRAFPLFPAHLFVPI